MCFDEIMRESQRVLNCSCKADCVKVSYDYYIVRENINVAAECNKTIENADLIEYLKTYQTEMHMTSFWSVSIDRQF